MRGGGLVRGSHRRGRCWGLGGEEWLKWIKGGHTVPSDPRVPCRRHEAEKSWSVFFGMSQGRGQISQAELHGVRLP